MTDATDPGSKKTPRTRTPKAVDDYQVFVSHATEDRWIARTICEKLEHSDVGARAFRDDRDIKGGDDIPDEIRRQIKRSKEMLVLLTPKSVDRDWVRFEVGGAWLSSKAFRITVVLYHVEVDAIPALLKSKKAITLNNLDDYLVEVSRRVKDWKK
jgi:hypothetical protein